NGPSSLVTLKAGASIDFTVRFQPTEVGSFSAVLTAGPATVIVFGSAISGLAVYLDDNGTRRELSATAVVNFGSVSAGGSAARRFIVENQSTQSLSVAVSVDSADFRVNGPATLPLAPQGSGSLEVVFQPVTGGTRSGNLQIGQRRISLLGASAQAAAPRPQIEVNLPSPASAKQGKVTVRLATAAAGTASGRIELGFRPDSGSMFNDAAVIFAQTGSRSASFTIQPGDTVVKFGSQTSLDFQTGTTAGTLLITVQLGSFTEQTTVTIPASPVSISAVRTVRIAAGLEVRITGFDNARTVSQAAFQFFDRSGQAIAPGRILVDVAEAFRSYFTVSDQGGMFDLRATFPVTGDASVVDSVEVDMTNTVATSHADRVRF